MAGLWLVGLVGQKIVVGTSKSFYVVFGQLLAPIQNFHPIRTENKEVENFHYWLVGRVGKSKNGLSHLKHSISIWRVKITSLLLIWPS